MKNLDCSQKDAENSNLQLIDSKFFVREDKDTGFISPRLVHRLIKITFGYPILAFCVLAAGLAGIWKIQITEANNGWGKDFFDEEKPHNNPTVFRDFYICILLSIVTATVAVLPVYYSITWLGRRIHSNMTFSLLHSKPTEFLHRTPNGVILNRFSNDVNILDNEVLQNFIPIIGSGMQLLVILVAVLGHMASYVALLPVTVFLVLGFKLRQGFMRAQVEVQRLSLISKSPIIGTAVGSIGGGPVIRVFGRQQYLRKKIDFEIEENTKNMLMTYGLRGWFSCLQEVYRVFIILWPLYSLMLYMQFSAPLGNQGLVSQVQYIQQLAGLFFATIMGTTNLEQAMILFERLNKYEKLEHEKGYKTISEDSELFSNMNKSKLKKIKKFLKEKERKKLDSELLVPQGEIRINDVSAKYPTSKEDVLSKLNIDIPAGQRVGIVGRTGAGKSSFIKLLWRALDPYVGSVKLDGKDLATLDVKEYRKEINMILQKPSLFEGTLLSNISPLEISTHKIQTLRQELIDLGFPINKLQESDLSFKVSEGGSNLSQSEKQIICLMQALQRDAKIVILDEATAYVDSGLEKKFQERLNRKFEGSTMLIIAHRISNVMDVDRVLVFDEGSVVEDGNPKELISKKEGAFHEIWKRG